MCVGKIQYIHDAAKPVMLGMHERSWDILHGWRTLQDDCYHCIIRNEPLVKIQLVQIYGLSKGWLKSDHVKKQELFPSQVVVPLPLPVQIVACSFSLILHPAETRQGQVNWVLERPLESSDYGLCFQQHPWICRQMIKPDVEVRCKRNGSCRKRKQGAGDRGMENYKPVR